MQNSRWFFVVLTFLNMEEAFSLTKIKVQLTHLFTARCNSEHFSCWVFRICFLQCTHGTSKRFLWKLEVTSPISLRFNKLAFMNCSRHFETLLSAVQSASVWLHKYYVMQRFWQVQRHLLAWMGRKICFRNTLLACGKNDRHWAQNLLGFPLMESLRISSTVFRNHVRKIFCRLAVAVYLAVRHIPWFISYVVIWHTSWKKKLVTEARCIFQNVELLHINPWWRLQGTKAKRDHVDVAQGTVSSP